jgi:hypothetical protein
MIQYPIFSYDNNKKELYDALIYFIFRPLSSIESLTIESTTDSKIHTTKRLLQIPDFSLGLLIRCLTYVFIILMIPITMINFFTYYLHTICRNLMHMLYGISFDPKTHKIFQMNLFNKVKYVTKDILNTIYRSFKKNVTKTNTSIHYILLFGLIFVQIILLEVLDKISLFNMTIMISLFTFLTSQVNQFIIIHLIELIIQPIISIPMIAMISIMFITEYISMANIHDLERPLVDKYLHEFLYLDTMDVNYYLLFILVIVRFAVLLFIYCYCIVSGILNIFWRTIVGKPMICKPMICKPMFGKPGKPIHPLTR